MKRGDPRYSCLPSNAPAGWNVSFTPSTIVIILGTAGSLGYVFRKYGRR